MGMTYVVHIVAGILGLVSGYVALFSMKGAPLHRKAGMLFVYAMLATSMAGMLMATVRDVAPAVNVPAALLTSYLVITALTTVRPLAVGARWVDLGAMLVALGVGLTSFSFAFEAVANGGKRHDIPAFPFFMFGFVGMVAAVLDLRMIRSGGVTGASRLSRHLWRMSFALFIAALSFFLGQARVFPKPIRIPALLAIPVLTVLVTMVYWLWRVRRKHQLTGAVRGAHHALMHRILTVLAIVVQAGCARQSVPVVISAPAAAEQRVVFLGNSITDGWAPLFPVLFPGKPYVVRGVSGETTGQMLVRFRRDVIALSPAVVVILGGTNDIAGNAGPSTLEMIEDNLASMTEIAQANGIRVVLSSVLPVFDYPWRRGLAPAPKILELNAWIKGYAARVGAVYLDYHSPMADARHGLRAELTRDGVHPTEAGYRVMSPLAEAAIAEALRTRRLNDKH